jgi:hypothetical protein
MNYLSEMATSSYRTAPYQPDYLKMAQFSAEYRHGALQDAVASSMNKPGTAGASDADLTQPDTDPFTRGS